MAHSLRMELKEEDIHVTDILVGRTGTEFNEKRLGKGALASQPVPPMAPEKVAKAIVRALDKSPRSVTLRLLDRLIMWANILVPDRVGQIVKSRYQ
jgi:short-subunit dehydrogenase